MVTAAAVSTARMMVSGCDGMGGRYPGFETARHPAPSGSVHGRHFMGKIILGFLLEKIWRWLSRIF
jgi:hypothetical protein